MMELLYGLITGVLFGFFFKKGMSFVMISKSGHYD